MFEAKKTLIVVYKDELLINQLKKMVETRDDDEQVIVGTKDDTINIVSWTEQVWLDNKKAGNIQGKILFIGNIKDTDKLIPVIDIKFDDCGVKFGWAGNQAIVYADPKALTTREDYDAFLEKLSALSVPDFLKPAKENIGAIGEEHKDEAAEEQPIESESEKTDVETKEPNEKQHKKEEIIKGVRNALSTMAEGIEKVGTKVATKSEEVFRNKSLMRRQMLFYGVVNLYNDGLDTFMNL